MNLRSEIEQLTPSLRRLAHSLVIGSDTAGADAADDLVHETLLRALRFDSPAKGISTRNWLYSILVGINRQRARSGMNAEASNAQPLRQRQNTLYTRPLPPDYVPSPGMHGSHPFKPGAQENAGEIFRGLVLEEREALMLVALEGLGYSQAAAILGLPRPTLVARLARARASLAARMERAPLQNASEVRAHLRLVK